MLWTIAVVFLVLWMLGLAGSFVMGGLIHILLVAAVVIVAAHLFTRRKVSR